MKIILSGYNFNTGMPCANPLQNNSLVNYVMNEAHVCLCGRIAQRLLKGSKTTHTAR